MQQSGRLAALEKQVEQRRAAVAAKEQDVQKRAAEEQAAKKRAALEIAAQKRAAKVQAAEELKAKALEEELAALAFRERQLEDKLIAAVRNLLAAAMHRDSFICMHIEHV